MTFQISKATTELARRIQAASSEPLTQCQAIRRALLFHERCLVVQEMLDDLKEERLAEATNSDQEFDPEATLCLEHMVKR